jgi:hypothetical protein
MPIFLPVLLLQQVKSDIKHLGPHLIGHFVIQWKNFKTFNTSGATFGPVLNFQVRLSEGSNAR